MDANVEWTVWRLKPGIPGLSPRDLKYYKQIQNVEHVVVLNSESEIVQVSSPTIGVKKPVKRRKRNGNKQIKQGNADT